MVLKNILKVLINKNLSLIRERLCYFVTIIMLLQLINSLFWQQYLGFLFF